MNTPLSVRTVDIEGISLNVFGYAGDHIFKSIASTGQLYEHDVLEFLGALLQTSNAGSVVDVGANLGNHTLYFAAVMGRQVVAIEPEKDNILALRRNVKDNGLEDHVIVYEGAAMDFSGNVFLEQNIEGNRGTFAVKPTGRIQVPADSVDHILQMNNVTDIALIKIDVEGSELKVLTGCSKTIQNHRPIIVVEVHQAHQMARVMSLLSPQGYHRATTLGISPTHVLIPDQVQSVDAALSSIVDAQREERVSTTRYIYRQYQRLADLLNVCTESVQNSHKLQDTLSGLNKDFQQFRHDLNAAIDRAADKIITELNTQTNTGVHEPIDKTEDDAELQALLRAYTRLSLRYERHHPHEWSTTAALTGVLRTSLGRAALHNITRSLLEQEHAEGQNVGSTPNSHVELHRGRITSDRIRVGIASMPGREETLNQVLEILSPQADEIFVYLNGISEIPEAVAPRRNVSFFTGPDLGDRGKFEFLDGFNGYYITCDDDIAYAKYHVSSLIDGIERYGRKAVVGWHGSVFSDNFEQFADPKSRKVLSFKLLCKEDTQVHLLGTGACGFHTDTLRISPEEFKYPNMADVFLALYAQKNQIPLVVIAHKRGEAVPLPTANSIYDAFLGNASQADRTMDLATVVSELVKKSMPWVFPPLPRPEPTV